MFAFRSSILLLLLILVVSFRHGQTTASRSCAPDTIDFATKVDKSSTVVYGRTMAKILNEATEATFHIFFQVDCVLKGPATLRQINITNAGRVNGKEYCQEFPVGRGYSVAFLEPSPSSQNDHKTFVPADFVEIVDDGKTIEQLLARTCSLHRLVPLQSSALVTEICPAVATDPLCQSTTIATTVNVIQLLANANLANLPESTAGNTSKAIGDASDVHGHLTKPIHTPQQELDAIRSKSGHPQVDVDKKSAAQSVTFNIFIVVIAAMFHRAM